MYWVVGRATNVGKTTISCALIKALENRQQKSIGFKPYSGVRFRDLIDFACSEYPVIPNKVFGGDGLALCQASSLTEDVDVDLVTPWQLVFNVSSDDTFFIRTGSEQLGNIQYYRTKEFEKMLVRKDLQRLVNLLKRPVNESKSLDMSKVVRQIIDKDVPNLAFNRLLERKPSSIVVEGAGPFLPVWKGCGRINHLVIVGETQISLIPHVNFILKFSDKPYFTQQLIKTMLSNPLNYKTYSMPAFLCEKANREAYLSQELEYLLSKAGL